VAGHDEDEVKLDSRMSKTLHSGLRVLELLAEHPQGLTITEVADGIGVHRTVAHRFLHTLEAHRLVRRDRAKRFHPGPGLVPLADPVDRDLRSVAQPLLEELADEAGATAHLVVQEGAEHVRALLVVEPRQASVHIAFRPGQLDKISVGSAGMAILAGQQPGPNERPEVRAARERGYALSFSEVIPSIHGLSAAVPGRRDQPLAVGLSVFDITDQDRLASLVLASAARLSRALS
jgi:DNA-binding IclR family transcriptional regulator